jgi:hypothetical protein
MAKSNYRIILDKLDEKYNGNPYKSIILDDINPDRNKTYIKQKHWIWWGFPQKDKSWGDRNVSNQTKQYALYDGDAKSLLENINFQKYYFQALNYLDIIVNRRDTSKYIEYDTLKHFYVVYVCICLNYNYYLDIYLDIFTNL